MGVNGSELERVVESLALEAELARHRLATAEVAAALGMDVTSIGEATAFRVRAVDHASFNRVIGLGLGRPATAHGIDRIVSHYRDAAITNAVIHVSTRAEPTLLGVDLEARNLPEIARWLRVARGPGHVEPVRCELRLVEIGAARADEYALAACECFEAPSALAPWLALAVGHPGFHHFAAIDLDRIVAVAQLYVKDAHAWLGVAATRPAHRRRGAYAALMELRVRRALDLGCRLIVSEAPAPAHGRHAPCFDALLRLGFDVVSERPDHRIALG